MDMKTGNIRDASEYSRFLPDLCNSKNVFLVVLTSELLAIILTVAPGVEINSFWTRLALISLFVQWVSITGVVLLCYARSFFERDSLIVSAILAYCTLLILTLIFSWISIWILHALNMNLGDGWAGDFLRRNLVISAIVSAVVLRYFYIQSQWRRNTEAEAQARIQALQARIRPHFLFNSMNTIASLTRTQPKEAETAVEDLAYLFRVSLAEKNVLTLAEEIEVTEGYLNIEKHRMGERLQVDWKIDPDVDLKTEVPALVLQPLVENSLYHGIEPLTEGGVVTINIENNKSGIVVSVSNPLTEDSNQRKHKGNQMAQDNIRQRLALAYDTENPLKVDATDSSYTVSFKIPRQKK